MAWTSYAHRAPTSRIHFNYINIMHISASTNFISPPHLTTQCVRWRHPFGLVRGLRNIRDKARVKKATKTQIVRECREIQRAEKATETQIVRESREILRADRKTAQEDMGIVTDSNVRTTRELNACLKVMCDEWNEQVPKQMRTFLEGKWDGEQPDQRNQLKLAAQRRLARSPCTNTTHWFCSADSFMPMGQLWASWYKWHELAIGNQFSSANHETPTKP